MKSVALLVLAGLAVAGCSAQNTASGDNYQAYLRNHSTGTQAPVVTGDTGYGEAAGGFGAPDEPVSTGSIGADTLAVLRQTAPAGVSNFVDEVPAAQASVSNAPIYGGTVSSAGSVPVTGTSGPNLAAYALSVDHAPGQAVYPRGGFHLTSTERACAKFPSSDRAQMAFLEKGGPQSDKLNLDPDGDGFACGWDPRPFQLARQ
ncbi:hypothetical protein [Paenirhodobacter populi]|uniref:hypothetical protein n=1 Tax=Paenirhodobacter populi TaxID=2306993 RepID=UPI000FE3279E|nr:hypothetical protein [Sinirhodobacter populi]RWR06070.1 hypothetical protein D2T32_15310 [Sinirhodobacter populi]